MRCALALSLGCGLLLGCDTTTPQVTPADAGTPAANATDPGAPSADAPAPATSGQEAADPAGDASSASLPAAANATPVSGTPVPIDSGVATLNPANTKIVFVGTHAPPKPKDPRTGGFEKFTGTAEVDAESKALKRVSVEIDTTSLWTQFDMLTTHLNSPDFFDTREYPTAKFESTTITAGDDGEHTIAGNLTLLETTKEISFPAKVTVSDDGLTLQAEFTINRLDFALGADQKGVEPPVALTVVVGEPTTRQ